MRFCERYWPKYLILCSTEKTCTGLEHDRIINFGWTIPHFKDANILACKHTHNILLSMFPLHSLFSSKQVVELYSDLWSSLCSFRLPSVMFLVSFFCSCQPFNKRALSFLPPVPLFLFIPCFSLLPSWGFSPLNGSIWLLRCSVCHSPATFFPLSMTHYSSSHVSFFLISLPQLVSFCLLWTLARCCLIQFAL